ncbi:MAG: transglutaminase family protein [Pseudomonadota bacterium]|nr:transglutaminase family protein [Pseudomonadota bacterium]
MAIRIALEHRTRYTYDRPVDLSPHEIRLRPASHARTLIEAYALAIRGARHSIHWQQDAYGNRVARAVFEGTAQELAIDVRLTAQLAAVNPFDFLVAEHADRFPFTYLPEERRALLPYLASAPAAASVAAWADRVAKRFGVGEAQTVEVLVGINQELSTGIDYETRMEPGVKPGQQTLGDARGSCRDSAWLLVEILRHCGFAARFVSGYLVQLASSKVGDDSRAGSDATEHHAAAPVHDSAAFHAWCEAYVPGAGWVGMDVTSGLLTAEGHIPLACAAEPHVAAPIIGRASASHSLLAFDTTVRRMDPGEPAGNAAHASLHAFRFRDAGTGEWRNATNKAELGEIAAHCSEFEILGEAPARRNEPLSGEAA